jgi:predicted amino acid-binding ACT domain protein
MHLLSHYIIVLFIISLDVTDTKKSSACQESSSLCLYHNEQLLNQGRPFVFDRQTHHFLAPFPPNKSSTLGVRTCDVLMIMNALITALTHTHMGTPPPDYHQEWAKHTVHWHGFANLPSERGAFVVSPEFMLLGNPWCLVIFPGGRIGSAEGLTSLYLYNMSNKSIDIDYGFSVSDGNGKQVAYGRSATPEHFEPEGTVNPEGTELNSWGFLNFGTRLTLFNSLVNGTLIIEVHVRLAKPTKSVPPYFIPENPFAKNIQRMIIDENFGDISFAVGAQQESNNAEKISKTTSVVFHAHRDILSKCSTGILADICQSSVMSSSPIEITDVSQEVFSHLLYSAYGVKISDEDMKSQTKEIIDAANRYGVVNLKLEAEAFLVRETVFSLENVMEHLQYAESMNCALLKEAAMDFIVENSAEVIDKLSFNDVVSPTLFRDVLAAVSRREKKSGVSGGGDSNNNSRFSSMRISELRRESHEMGLNVDGSREMLIAALKAVQEVEVESEKDSEE